MNNEFIREMVTNLIASFPQLVIVLTAITSFVRTSKKKLKEFPDIVNNTQNIVEKKLNEANEKMNKAFVETSEKIVSVTQNVTNKIQEKVNGSLEKMEEKLSRYDDELRIAREQMSMSVKEGKVFIDIITELVAKEPQMIKDKMAQFVSAKANMVKKELEQFPEMLVADYKLLEKSLQEAKKIIGEEKIDEMLGRIGYERKKEEE